MQGRVTTFEAELVRMSSSGLIEEGKETTSNDAFQKLTEVWENANGAAIGGAGRIFTRFGDREEGRLFPREWKNGMTEAGIENAREVGNGRGRKVSYL